MVILTYSIGDNPQQIIVDAGLNEQHAATAQVTEHPAETGFNITDHIRPLPRRISLELFVTNTPISAMVRPVSGTVNPISPQNLTQLNGSTADANTLYEYDLGGRFNGGQFGNADLIVRYKALGFSALFDRVSTIYDALVEARAAGALFTVTTSLAVYENMAIVNLTAPRNVALSNAIQFMLELQEIRIVDTQVTEALPSSIPKKVARQDRGAKPGKEVTKTDNRTLLAKTSDAATNFLKSFGK